METKNFIGEDLKAVKKIISELPNDRFDSHEFIRSFAKHFEISYIRFLKCYNEAPFRKVHAQIALELLKNMNYLKIEKNGKVMSENIFGTNNQNEEWIKL